MATKKEMEGIMQHVGKDLQSLNVEALTKDATSGTPTADEQATQKGRTQTTSKPGKNNKRQKGGYLCHQGIESAIVTFKLNKELVKALKHAAIDTDMMQCEIVNEAIQMWLKQYKENY